MKNVKKVIAGILLTATVLGTGTQLSVGAARYNLEGLFSEVSLNKRPSKMKNKFYIEMNAYSKAGSNAKVQKELENLDRLYDETLFRYSIDSYETYKKDNEFTIDTCREKWNEIVKQCNKLGNKDEAEKCKLMKQIAGANIAWFNSEENFTVENWNNVASKFETVAQAINEDFSKNQAYAKIVTARAYAALAELRKTENPTEENCARVGNLLIDAANKNYYNLSTDIKCYGLAKECVDKFEEICMKVKTMDGEIAKDLASQMNEQLSSIKQMVQVGEGMDFGHDGLF